MNIYYLHTFFFKEMKSSADPGSTNRKTWVQILTWLVTICVVLSYSTSISPPVKGVNSSNLIQLQWKDKKEIIHVKHSA